MDVATVESLSDYLADSEEIDFEGNVLTEDGHIVD